MVQENQFELLKQAVVTIWNSGDLAALAQKVFQGDFPAGFFYDNTDSLMEDLNEIVRTVVGDMEFRV